MDYEDEGTELRPKFGLVKMSADNRHEEKNQDRIIAMIESIFSEISSIDPFSLVSIAFIVHSIALGIYFGHGTSSAGKDYEIFTSMRSMSFRYALVIEMTTAGMAIILFLAEECLLKKKFLANKESNLTLFVAIVTFSSSAAVFFYCIEFNNYILVHSFQLCRIVSVYWASITCSIHFSRNIFSKRWLLLYAITGALGLQLHLLQTIFATKSGVLQRASSTLTVGSAACFSVFCVRWYWIIYRKYKSRITITRNDWKCTMYASTFILILAVLIWHPLFVSQRTLVDYTVSDLVSGEIIFMVFFFGIPRLPVVLSDLEGY